MKTLILYASKHGCTEKCAQTVKEKLTGNTDLFRIKNVSEADLSGYETVVIGGSIHAGKIQKEVRVFCEKYFDILMKMKLGLFLCCMEAGEKAAAQFNNAFPRELLDHAAATGMFGGEFNFERMNFIEKAIVKKVANVDQSVSKILDERIETFVRQIESGV